MKKLLTKLLLLIIITLLILSGLAVAQAPAQVQFIAKEADDIIDLTLKIENTTFMGIQATLNYNPKELVPINDRGDEAKDYPDFTTVSAKGKVFATAGLKLDAEKGKIDFTYFIMPGARADEINDNNEFVANEQGVEICSFRFKKVSDDYSFNQGGNPQITIMDYATGKLETNVTFIYPEKEAESVTITPPAKEDPKEEKPELTSEDRKKDVICLQVGKRLAFAHGKRMFIDADNNKVVPYIKNDRTLVPIRFVAESLRAEVLWEEGWDGCVIKKGEKEIKLTFNSKDFFVNGKKVSLDAPIELLHDRTMVPIRFVSEQLGCDVYWNELNKAVVISPLDNKWQEKREAEVTALGEMLVTISGLIP